MIFLYLILKGKRTNQSKVKTKHSVYSFTLSLFHSFSIEPMTLQLLAPRSTDWANGPLDARVLQISSFYGVNVGKLLKKECNPNRKWILFRMSLEHRTLPLSAPRSTDWASGPLDANVHQISGFYEVNIGKLLKKRT